MDKVVKYVRVPVKNQKKILEEQQKELMQYAEERGFEVAEVGILCKKTGETEELKGIYADEGTNTRDFMNVKEAFLRMTEQAEQGLFNQIFMKDITEFVKANVLDLEVGFVILKPIKVIEELREYGVNIYFEKENINSIGKDTLLKDLIKVAEHKFINEIQRRYEREIKTKSIE